MRMVLYRAAREGRLSVSHSHSLSLILSLSFSLSLSLPRLPFVQFAIIGNGLACKHRISRNQNVVSRVARPGLSLLVVCSTLGPVPFTLFFQFVHVAARSDGN